MHEIWITGIEVKDTGNIMEKCGRKFSNLRDTYLCFKREKRTQNTQDLKQTS